jgi:hypothetical protein
MINMKTILFWICFCGITAISTAQNYSYVVGIKQKYVQGSASQLGGDEWNFKGDWVLRMNKSELIHKVTLSDKNTSELNGKLIIEITNRQSTSILYTKSVPFNKVKVISQNAQIPFNLDFTEVSGLDIELKMLVKFYVNNQFIGQSENKITRIIK